MMNFFLVAFQIKDPLEVYIKQALE
jgi:hypothetical protein